MTSSITEQLDDGFVQDPHAAFERLRAERPVTRVALPGGHPVWLVTRYADAPRRAGRLAPDQGLAHPLAGDGRRPGRGDGCAGYPHA